MEIPKAIISSLRAAQNITVLTGAGISAESGVPTFRDAQSGLWAKHSPEDLATPAAFRKNPYLVWKWYTWRRELVSRAIPNPGHIALASMEKIVPLFTLITQNIDGLHQSAGNKKVIELHGNIHKFKCSVENIPVEDWKETGDIPPHCPRCNAMLRPDVVWFGENLPREALDDAWQAAKTCQVFLSIGTSALVQPAASLPLVAHRAGALLIEINPNPTPISEWVDYIFQQPAGIILPAIVQVTWRIDGDSFE